MTFPNQVMDLNNTEAVKNTSVKTVGHLPGIEPMSAVLPHSERRE